MLNKHVLGDTKQVRLHELQTHRYTQTSDTQRHTHTHRNTHPQARTDTDTRTQTHTATHTNTRTCTTRRTQRHVQTISEELKTTLFVARKVLALRDEHAAGHA